MSPFLGTMNLLCCVITVMDICVYHSCCFVEVQVMKHCNLIQNPLPHSWELGIFHASAVYNPKSPCHGRRQHKDIPNSQKLSAELDSRIFLCCF